ncbi:MAG: YggT family protein [Candidatus Omnitrophica bacterium]|nr:YggT family protein [Candidatus Omnitrophota bacterium]
MFILANFLSALVDVFNIAVNVYMFLIIGRVIVSWLNPDLHNPVVQFINGITDVVLEPIRRVLPQSLRYPLDISPAIACFALFFLQRFLTPTLSYYIGKLR